MSKTQIECLKCNKESITKFHKFVCEKKGCVNLCPNCNSYLMIIYNDVRNCSNKQEYVVQCQNDKCGKIIVEFTE